MMPALLTSDFRIASLSSCLALKRLLWRQQFVTFKFLDLRRSSLPSRAEFCAGGNRDRRNLCVSHYLDRSPDLHLLAVFSESLK